MDESAVIAKAAVILAARMAGSAVALAVQLAESALTVIGKAASTLDDGLTQPAAGPEFGSWSTLS